MEGGTDLRMIGRDLDREGVRMRGYIGLEGRRNYEVYNGKG